MPHKLPFEVACVTWHKIPQLEHLGFVSSVSISSSSSLIEGSELFAAPLGSALDASLEDDSLLLLSSL